MPYTLHSFLIIGALLFCFGVYTVLTRRNAIGILMGIELLMNAAVLNFAAFNRFLPPERLDPPLGGQVFTLFIIAVAVAEVAVALAIVMALYKRQVNIDVHQFEDLKG